MSIEVVAEIVMVYAGAYGNNDRILVLLRAPSSSGQ